MIMWNHQMEGIDIERLHHELSVRCRAAADSRNFALPDLIDFVLRYEKRLNQLAFIEKLLIPIKAVKKIDSEPMETYCKTVNRIIRRTDLQNGQHYLSFQTSVILQLIELWANQRSWPS
jgi:hypothetical protein